MALVLWAFSIWTHFCIVFSILMWTAKMIWKQVWMENFWCIFYTEDSNFKWKWISANRVWSDPKCQTQMLNESDKMIAQHLYSVCARLNIAYEFWDWLRPVIIPYHLIMVEAFKTMCMTQCELLKRWAWLHERVTMRLNYILKSMPVYLKGFQYIRLVT